MLKQFIVTVLILVPSLIITGLMVLWIKHIFPIVLGFELPDLAFVVLFVTSFSLVYSLATRPVFRAIAKISKQELSRQHSNKSREAVMPAVGNVVLTRTHSYVNRLNAYQVFIDGLSVEQITDGETKAYRVVPGSHEVTIRIDWCETKPIRISVSAEDTKYIACGPNLDGIRFLMFPWYLTFGRHNYLWLKERLS